MDTRTCSERSLKRAHARRSRGRVALGQGLVEYALILMLVAMVVIGVLSALGDETEQVFGQVNCSLSGKEYHQDNGNGNSNKCK